MENGPVYTGCERNSAMGDEVTKKDLQSLQGLCQ